MNNDELLNDLFSLDNANRNIKEAIDSFLLQITEKLDRIKFVTTATIEENKDNCQLKEMLQSKKALLIEKREQFSFFQANENQCEAKTIIASIINENKLIDFDIDNTSQRERRIRLKEAVINRLLMNDEIVFDTVSSSNKLMRTPQAKAKQLRTKVTQYTPNCLKRNDNFLINNKANNKSSTQLGRKVAPGSLLKKKNNNESRNGLVTQYSKTISQVSVNKSVHPNSRTLTNQMNNTKAIINNIVTRSKVNANVTGNDSPTKNSPNKIAIYKAKGTHKHYNTKENNNSKKTSLTNTPTKSIEKGMSHPLSYSTPLLLIRTSQIRSDQSLFIQKANPLAAGKTQSQSSLSTNTPSILTKAKPDCAEEVSKLPQEDANNTLHHSLSSPTLHIILDEGRINTLQESNEDIPSNITKEEISLKVKLLMKKVKDSQSSSHNSLSHFSQAQKGALPHININEIKSLLMSNDECVLNGSNGNTVVNQNKELIFNRYNDNNGDHGGGLIGEEAERESKKTLLKEKLEELLKQKERIAVGENGPHCALGGNALKLSIDVIVENENEGENRYDTLNQKTEEKREADNVVCNDKDEGQNDLTELIHEDAMKISENKGINKEPLLENEELRHKLSKRKDLIVKKNGAKNIIRILNDNDSTSGHDNVSFINTQNKNSKSSMNNYSQSEKCLKKLQKRAQSLSNKEISPSLKIKVNQMIQSNLPTSKSCPTNLKVIKGKAPPLSSKPTPIFIAPSSATRNTPTLQPSLKKQKERKKFNLKETSIDESNSSNPIFQCQTENNIAKPKAKRQLNGVIDFNIDINNVNLSTSNHITSSIESPIKPSLSNKKPVKPMITCTNEDSLAIKPLMSKKAKDSKASFSFGNSLKSNMLLPVCPNEPKTTLARNQGSKPNGQDKPKSRYRQELDEILITLDNITTCKNQRISNPLEPLAPNSTKYIALMNCKDESKKNIVFRSIHNSHSDLIEEVEPQPLLKGVKAKPSLQIEINDNHYILKQQRDKEESSDKASSEVQSNKDSMSYDSERIDSSLTSAQHTISAPLQKRILNGSNNISDEGNCDNSNNCPKKNMPQNGPGLKISNLTSLNFQSNAFYSQVQNLTLTQQEEYERHEKQASISSPLSKNYYNHYLGDGTEITKKHNMIIKPNENSLQINSLYSAKAQRFTQLLGKVITLKIEKFLLLLQESFSTGKIPKEKELEAHEANKSEAF